MECAAIFAIFTAQAWNMAFSFYQSLKTLPADLDEAARQFGLSPWQRFWRLELPFATPALVWNTMMSMSGGWFFVVASEAITVGKTTVTLPGIGSWLAVAIDRRRLRARSPGRSAAMAVVILLYDQLLFRPIVAWADKFRFEQTAVAGPAALLVLRRAAPHAPAARGSAGRSASCSTRSSACRSRARAPRQADAIRASARRLDAAWLGAGRRPGGLAAPGWWSRYVAAHPALARRADRLRPGLPDPDRGCWC